MSAGRFQASSRDYNQLNVPKKLNYSFNTYDLISVQLTVAVFTSGLHITSRTRVETQVDATPRQ